MKWTNVRYKEVKCKYCHKKFKSMYKEINAVCPNCEYKDNRCIAITGWKGRCKNNKLSGEFYCKDHLPSKGE